jgi:hypothetical protein
MRRRSPQTDAMEEISLPEVLLPIVDSEPTPSCL